MDCFGDMKPTKEVATSSTSGPPKWVQKAGEENYNIAKSIFDKGFVPYSGELSAALAPNQQQASDLISTTAATGNPYTGDIESAVRGAGQAPGFNYDFSTVVDPNGPLGSIGDYINPYLAEVLNPTLREIGISGAQARNSINANATGAGAFGDARHGVVESQQRKNQQQLETDTTGKALSDAFGTALGLRQQDLSRFFSTQQAQQSADEAKLARMRQSGIDLGNLDTSNVNRATTLATALGQTGGVEQQTQQASDTANFNEFLRQQGWDDNQISFLTSILSQTPKATVSNATQTTSQPDNSGFQAIGTLASTLLPLI